MSVLFAILIFSLLIFVHELGHFITAKLSGVQVNEFAMFMGPVIWKKQVGETLYSIRSIPLGGYCAMEGEDSDTDNFPCLALAYRCAKQGGTACPAMNGANEEAVAMYLRDEIGFYDIYSLVSRAVEQVPFIRDPSLEQILESDRLARAAVRSF